MFREIDAQCYIMADGDDTYPAEFAPSMVEKVLNKKERHAKKAVVSGFLLVSLQIGVVIISSV